MRSIILSSFILLFGSAFAQDSVKTTIYFPSDNYLIQSNQEAAIREVLDFTKVNSDFEITLSGHTDNEGSNQYNLNLSQQRSKSVYERLVSRGISRDKIILSHFGEDRPLNENSNESDKQDNRRVDITIRNLEQKNSGTIDDLYKLLKVPTQSFCYDFNLDTLIKISDGSILWFRANSFNVNPDTLTECIKISYKEITSKSDIIRDNLSTTTKGGILISHSMPFIEATYKGKPISLNTEITVFTPTNTFNDDMMYFDGHRDEDNHMNWSNTAGIWNVNSGIFNPCFIPGGESSDNCKFFFCKIGNFTRKTFTPTKYKAQKAEERQRRDLFNQQVIQCADLEKKLNEFTEKYGDLPIDQLGDIPKKDLNFYVFNRPQGWSNLDWMMKISNTVNFIVDVPPSEQIDVKVVFAKQRSIVTLNGINDQFSKSGMPYGYEAYVVALKYANGQPSLAIKKTLISGQPVEDLVFKKYSIPELKEKLEILNS